MSDVAKNLKEQKRRPKKKYHPWLRLLVRLLIVALVVLSGVLTWNNWEKIAPEAVLDWAETRFGGAPVGKGFPVTIEGNSVADMNEISRYLVTLTDTSLHFYSPSAARVVTRNHSFSEPTLNTAGRYVLITEIGGSRLRLDTRRQTVLTKEFENRKIYASCLLSSGMVAVVTDSASQSYLCEIRVYDRKGKEIFTYQSRKYLLTNISLADNGKSIAAVGTNAEGGMLKSVLLMFDFSKKEPTEYSGTDLLLYDVNYFDNDSVMAVGDKEVWILPARGNTVEKIALNGFDPVGFSATPALSGLVVRRSGSTGDDFLWIFDGGGTPWKSEKLDGGFRNISCQSNGILVLTETHAYSFGKSEMVSQAETPSDSLLITEYRDSPLLLTLSELKRIAS